MFVRYLTEISIRIVCSDRDCYEQADDEADAVKRVNAIGRYGEHAGDKKDATSDGTECCDCEVLRGVLEHVSVPLSIGNLRYAERTTNCLGTIKNIPDDVTIRGLPISKFIYTTQMGTQLRRRYKAENHIYKSSISIYNGNQQEEKQKERKPAMKKTNDIIISNGSYDTTYEATYEADHNITTSEAENLMSKHYHMFPITHSTYKLNGNTMAITYTIDNCN